MKLKHIAVIYFLIISSCTQHKEIIIEKFKSGKTKVTETVISIHANDTLKKITGYRENEKLSYIGFLVNDQLDSVFTRWHVNSYNVSERINYNHGKRNGLSAGWFIDGKKNYEVNYLNDFRNGTETTWYENGNKKSEGSYEEGKNVELWMYWYENGNKKEEGSYKGGEFEQLDPEKNTGIPFEDRIRNHKFIPLKHGKWTYWNENGELIKTEFWEQGNLKDK